ncbi:Bromodomain-containing protein [Schistosoma japonicum]|uniref:Bromodomain-containing protein n=1 Tax=Schistosoma japonicum TaxID=6182 RepID=A0A4Z2DVS3_SCHJA|nr:Bromodomain-containing protein [Schistosoma japonicum]
MNNNAVINNDECGSSNNNNATLRNGFSRIERKRYTLVDDEAITKYLMQNSLWRYVRSRAVWRRMAKERITEHSSESMRSRFRHHLINSVYARLSNTLTRSERKELHNIFFGCSNNQLEKNTDDDALNDDNICESSYSIDECSLNLNESNLVMNESDKPANRQTSLTVVQSEKYDDVSPDLIEMFSVFSSSDQSSPCSYESPKRLCNNCPVPPPILAANKKKIFTSNGLVNDSGSLSTSNKSPLMLIPGIPCEDATPQTHSSIMTSDSSVPISPTNCPVWISELINCSPYLTTPLQALILVHMTNGSIAEARSFLTTGKRRPSSVTHFSPPLWLPEDDECLGSPDKKKLDELVIRFGWTEIIYFCVYFLFEDFSSLFLYFMNKNPLTPVPSERLLGPGYGQGVWPLRERLALATALLDVDNQQGSWAATSRRMMCFSRPGRPPTWCSSKACAKQYALLLDSIELVKRQKIPGCDTQTSQLSLAERVVKRLSAERAEELRSRIRLGQLYYTSLKNIISEVESGIYDSQLMDLLSVINPITDCKKKSENLDGESIQTTVLVNDDTSEQQTIVANDTTNASQSNDCNKYSDKSTAESGSFDNNQSCTESFIGLWKEIQGFYHIPDSTWYCAPGPINNRISTSAYGGVTSRSRQSAGVGSLNFSRLSTLLAEASSPSLKPATEFRNSTNKSSSYKPSLHDTSHTTAASRAAEAAKQRYLSKKGKNKFSSRKSQLDRNYKTMKQDNKLKNWSKNISRNSLYDCTATSSPSKADHIKRDWYLEK